MSYSVSSENDILYNLDASGLFLRLKSPLTTSPCPGLCSCPSPGCGVS